MSDNGTPFVMRMPGVLTLFGKTLEELRIRHLRTQVNPPWTNGKIERFWGILQSEVLDRELFRTLDAADDWLIRFAANYNYDRVHSAYARTTRPSTPGHHGARDAQKPHRCV